MNNNFLTIFNKAIICQKILSKKVVFFYGILFLVFVISLIISFKQIISIKQINW